MSNYASIDAVAGTPAIGTMYAPFATDDFAQGGIMNAIDGWWGGGEFMWVKFGGSVRQFGLVVVKPTWNSTLSKFEFVATETGNTGHQTRAVYVSMCAASSGQYGWVCQSGLVPINSSAAVAADTPIGIAAAGQGGAAGTAGKQLIGAIVVAASTTTVVKTNCIANSGSTDLYIPQGHNGWFPGVYLSGTGIAAGTTVSSVDTGGNRVVLSAATTAAVAGSITATYNNATVYYNVAHINRPHCAGAIDAT